MTAATTEHLLGIAARVQNEQLDVLWVTQSHAAARDRVFELHRDLPVTDRLDRFCLALGLEAYQHADGGRIRFVNCSEAARRAPARDLVVLDLGDHELSDAHAMAIRAIAVRAREGMFEL